MKKRRRAYRPRIPGLKKIGRGLFLATIRSIWGGDDVTIVDADHPDDGRPISIRGALSQLVAMAKKEPRPCGCPPRYVIHAQAHVIERAKLLLDPNWAESERRAADWRAHVKRRDCL